MSRKKDSESFKVAKWESLWRFESLCEIASWQAVPGAVRGVQQRAPVLPARQTPARLRPEPRRPLTALCCWAGSSQRSKGLWGGTRHLFSPFCLSHPLGRAGVSALLLPILPAAAGRGCSEHPSPFCGSRLSHLQKRGSKGKVLASGRLEGTWRAATVITPQTRACCLLLTHSLGTGTSPALHLLRHCGWYPGVLPRCFQIPGGKSAAQMLKVINIYSAKIITAGRQQAAGPGRSQEPPVLLPAGFGSCHLP